MIAVLHCDSRRRPTSHRKRGAPSPSQKENMKGGERGSFLVLLEEGIRSPKSYVAQACPAPLRAPPSRGRRRGCRVARIARHPASDARDGHPLRVPRGGGLFCALPTRFGRARSEGGVANFCVACSPALACVGSREGGVHWASALRSRSVVRLPPPRLPFVGLFSRQHEADAISCVACCFPHACLFCFLQQPLQNHYPINHA